jgi:hypothetical protein
MGLQLKTAEEIAKNLRRLDADLKVEIKGSDNQVVATSKSLILESSELRKLEQITKGCQLNFGRSGANFRMIVY